MWQEQISVSINHLYHNQYRHTLKTSYSARVCELLLCVQRKEMSMNQVSTEDVSVCGLEHTKEGCFLFVWFALKGTLTQSIRKWLSEPAKVADGWWSSCFWDVLQNQKKRKENKFHYSFTFSPQVTFQHVCLLWFIRCLPWVCECTAVLSAPNLHSPLTSPVG